MWDEEEQPRMNAAAFFLLVGRVWGGKCAHLRFWPGAAIRKGHFYSRTRRFLDGQAVPISLSMRRVREQTRYARATANGKRDGLSGSGPIPAQYYADLVLRLREQGQIPTSWDVRQGCLTYHDNVKINKGITVPLFF
jgi:hypothetical protein